MEHKLSKVYLAMAAAGLGASVCTTSFARSENNVPVVVPVNQASYHFALTGLYLQLSNDDMFYAVSGDDTGFREFRAVGACYDWGFRLDGGVRLGESGNDLSANWTYISGGDDDRINKSDRQNNDLASRWIGGGNASRWDSVYGEMCFDFNEVNVEVGQLVDFCSLHARFHFGFSYASVDHDFNTNAFEDTTSSSRTGFGRSRGCSSFWGVGPRVGADVTYPLGDKCSNFSLVGHAAVALLAGELCVDQSWAEHQKDGDRSTNATIKVSEVCTVVPASTLKLGLRYASASDPGLGGYGVEFGWQATGYYHAISHGLSTHDDLGISNHISNFTLSGVYLTLSYSG